MSFTRSITQSTLAAVLVGSATVCLAETTIKSERVTFSRGDSSAVMEGRIKGDEIIDYLVRAKAGQYLNASLATDNSANYFNILAPGETEVAFFNGSLSENQFEGSVPASGDMRFRVYLMRSAARRAETAHYRLEIIIGGTAGEAPVATHDALVPGTHFHATGSVPCTMTAGGAPASCPFGVERHGGGSATVTVTRPDGSTRPIFFDAGKAVAYDGSEADSGAFSAVREGDDTIVHIGAESYRIPDAAIFGG